MNRSALLRFAALLCLTLHAYGAGTWVPLAHPPPVAIGHFLLLSDGTVMGESFATNWGPGWYRLTPDIHGSYANGTWSPMASMNYTRLDFSSDVLTNGDVFVAGGEYGSGSNTAEIYNPVADSWSTVTIPTGTVVSFVDSDSVLLSNGKVLITPVYPTVSGQTLTYDPAANVWAAATLKQGGDQDEASTVKLPDDSILVVDSQGTTSERFIPSTGTWIADANVPVSLYETNGGEEGPGVLLPNGKVIFFGGTTNTAIYTPSGNNNPGTWLAGPGFPNNQSMPDSPAAVMVNGKVLCAVATAPNSTTEWSPPVTFYEYDYTTNGFAKVSAPGGGTSFNDVSWPTLMLDLPDGTVLFGHRQTDFYVYQPDGVPLAAGKPVINNITVNPDGSLHLTGTLFNGLSQGAAYGDDEQMDSNFPIVRFTDALGNVRYGRTYNWNNTGVMKNGVVVSVDCAMPAGASLSDNIQVVANGIASGYNMVVENTNDSGPGSLRQLVNTLPPGSTITFAAYLSGQSIGLTAGPIVLGDNLTIDASALGNGIQINGNQNSSIFTVNGGVTALLGSLTLTNGWGGTSGSGGAVVNSGTLTMNRCTLAGNLATNGVGGAIYNEGALTLTACTLVSNYASFAGAIQNYGPCFLENCTFVGNQAPANGGAIDNDFSGAVLGVIQCTFVGNSAGSLGGGIDNYLANLNVTNSLLAGNTAGDLGPDIYNWGSSFVTIGGTNLVPGLGNNGVISNAGGILTAAPMLAPLGNHGGPTQTMPPLSGSPAIDAGSDAAAAGILTDQRGYQRVVGPHVDIGAVEYESPVVTSAADNGIGSLRYAVTYSANNGTITFSNVPGNHIVLTNGPIALNNLTIDASSVSNGMVIDGNGKSMIFNITGTVTLTSLTISNAYGTGFGGAILSTGNLTVDDCQLVNNTCTGTAGALAAAFGQMTMSNTTVSGNVCENCSAVYVQDQPVTLFGCTVNGNSGASGDALRVDAASANSLLTAVDCTFSGNTIDSGWGAAISLGSLAGLTASGVLTNCTIVSNTVLETSQPGAIFLQPGGGTVSMTAYNTIVSGNTSGGAPGDITGNLNAASAYNLIGVGGGLTSANGNLVGIDNPQLAALGYYGGPTETMPPLYGSPVIDAGGNADATGISTDQRGLPRVAGPSVDIGAAELQPSPLILNTNDFGYGSLRYACDYLPGSSAISFASMLSGKSIGLTNGPITLANDLNIDASSLSNGIQINGNHQSSILTVNNGVTAVLDSLTLTNGWGGTYGSGAGLVNTGTLTMNRCNLADNVATNGNGGAIASSGTLTLTACTLVSNYAVFAGAIQNYGPCFLENCTFVGNQAPANGGAIDNDFSGAVLAVTQCTFSGNSATYNGGAIDNYLATLNLTNSLLAGNTSGVGSPDIYNWGSSFVTIGGTNLVPGLVNAGTVSGTGTVLTAAPMLAPLGNYGGPTMTMPPLAGSPAINAGSDAAAAGILTDQRGYPRFSGSHVDIGAVEVQIASHPILLGLESFTAPGTFHFSFTNQLAGSFTVFASTNLALPPNEWIDLGPAVENPLGSGRFSFTDTQTSTNKYRFYVVRSP